jgi:hypothetical protein
VQVGIVLNVTKISGFLASIPCFTCCNEISDPPAFFREFWICGASDTQQNTKGNNPTLVPLTILVVRVAGIWIKGFHYIPDESTSSVAVSRAA